MRTLLEMILVSTFFMLATSPAAAQTIYLPQQIGVSRSQIEYPTPIRDFLFGRYRSTPIYQWKPYQVVTPPPRVYQPPAQVYQPPQYLVPIQPQSYRIEVVR